MTNEKSLGGSDAEALTSCSPDQPNAENIAQSAVLSEAATPASRKGVGTTIHGKRSRDRNSQLSELGRAALDYASRGIQVFPCWPGSKKPATPNGFKDATSDLATIKAWWTKNPECNVALSPEAASWCVVDLDGGEVGEASWAKLQAEYGAAPSSHEVRTPSGGRHIYFCGSLPPSTSTIAPKVDTRGTGSYVLVPPSVVDERGEPNKPEKWGSYRSSAAPWDQLIADVPRWLVDLFGASAATARYRPSRVPLALSVGISAEVVAAELKRQAQRVAEALPGTRNATLFKAAADLGELVGAGALRRGYADALLEAAAELSGLIDDDGIGSARATIDSGLNRGMAKPRGSAQ